MAIRRGANPMVYGTTLQAEIVGRQNLLRETRAILLSENTSLVCISTLLGVALA